MTIILDGKKTAKEIQEELQVAISKSSIIPKLAVILVGDDPASAIYVKNKKKACEEIGMLNETIYLPFKTTQKELTEHIKRLNEDVSVHGILVQVPLPEHINEEQVLSEINSTKDVDGFHPTNIGKMVLGQKTLLSCTPAGIIYLLKKYKIDLLGKEAVIVGRSNIVGKPVSLLLLSEHATVTICHSRTKDLGQVVKRADILVVAIGKPKMITAEMIKDGAVVIDVGANWIEENGQKKYVGDVDFEKVSLKTKAISPVPGGVGPMTIAMLMRNVCLATGIVLS